MNDTILKVISQATNVVFEILNLMMIESVRDLCIEENISDCLNILLWFPVELDRLFVLSESKGKKLFVLVLI